MKTEHEYETFGPEWRASLKGMSKAHIIELFSKVGKEKEKLEEINAELLEALKPFEKLAKEVLQDIHRPDLERVLYAFNKAEVKYSDLRRVIAAITKAEGKTE